MASWNKYYLKKILCSTTIIIYNKKLLLEQWISILKWFLKDHVTLKTGVIDALQDSNKLHLNILKQKTIKL